MTKLLETTKRPPAANRSLANSLPGEGALRFDSPEQEAYLNLWRTYDRLRALEDALFAEFDLTAQQYNILRLLRAERPESLPTLQIAERLVSRAPDITRMLDKLEAQGRIERRRGESDRRTVFVAITSGGAALVKRIAKPLAACHRRQLGHLSASDLKQLTQLLQKARMPHEGERSQWR